MGRGQLSSQRPPSSGQEPLLTRRQRDWGQMRGILSQPASTQRAAMSFKVLALSTKVMHSLPQPRLVETLMEQARANAVHILALGISF